MSEHESAHVKALKARQPFSMTLDITGCYGHTGDPLPKVLVRVNSKKDDNEAIVAAHVAAAQRAKLEAQLGEAGTQRLVNDPDFLTDMKTVEALWRAFRDADNPEMHAWPTPEWMKANMDSDQLGALLNLYEHVRQKRGPRPFSVTPEWVELIRDACVASGDDLPESPLLGFSREYLAAFIVETMRCWDAERRKLNEAVALLTSKKKACKSKSESEATQPNEPSEQPAS